MAQVQFSKKEKIVIGVVASLLILAGAVKFGEKYHPFGTADKIVVYAAKQVDQSSVQANLGYNPSSSNRNVYIVKEGDTLFKIAKKYGFEVEVIQFANNIEGTLIVPGQKLLIPVKD